MGNQQATQEQLSQAYGGIVPQLAPGSQQDRPLNANKAEDFKATMTSTHTGGHALPAEIKNELQNQHQQTSKNLQAMKLRDYLNRSDKSSNLDL